jgi:hypothetical protein
MYLISFIHRRLTNKLNTPCFMTIKCERQNIKLFPTGPPVSEGGGAVGNGFTSDSVMSAARRVVTRHRVIVSDLHFTQSRASIRIFAVSLFYSKQ